MRVYRAAWPLRLGRRDRGNKFGKFEKWYAIVVKTMKVELQFLPWKGIAWRASRFKGHTTGEWTRPMFVRGRPEMKKKTVVAANPEGKHLAAVETERFSDMLPIVEHLAMTKYDDGDPRVPGIIILKTNGVAWQCIVKDNDSAMCFTATGKTLDEALETAALHLGCDAAPWEVDQYAKRQGRKKKS